MIPQRLTDLSHPMGLGLALEEQTTSIDFEVNARHAWRRKVMA